MTPIQYSKDIDDSEDEHNTDLEGKAITEERKK
jgi:hypothetical protein